MALAGIAALAALLLGAPSALADALTPESGGSSNADDIDTLYKIALYIAIVIFAGVEITLVYSLVKFRARKGATAAQIHGNTRLEVGWTVAAALIVVVLSVITFIALPGISDPPASDPDGLPLANAAQFASTDKPDVPDDKALEIDVNGQQYLWRYTYPDGTYSYEEMVVPARTTVLLRIRAQDVAHSWWIPKLGGKMDALPGYTNWAWFKARKPGLYVGQCAELCGRNHANMTARVRVVEVTEYQAWLERQKQLISDANRLAASSRLAQETGSGGQEETAAEDEQSTGGAEAEGGETGGRETDSSQ